MAPTTAADRTLVRSSMTRSLDWMLTRDISRRRLRLADSVESVASTVGASSVDVVIGCKD
jgi:hypothetical protein